MSKYKKRVINLTIGVALILLSLACIITMLFSSCGNGQVPENNVNGLATLEPIIVETAATIPPQPIQEQELNPISDSDLYWLARIMQAEDGHYWADEDIMKLGEVALNRVASPLFPNTVREVALQGTEDLNDNIPTQYEPFENYEEWMPAPYYIYLAARLLNGERVLNEPDAIWQALFVQGEIVDTIYDPFFENTTYICK